MALGLGAVGTGAGLVLLAGQAPEPAPVSVAEASEAAAGACASAARFERLVRDNAPLDKVREALDAAERQAETAARGDATWVALVAGVQSVRVALAADDERAARVGIGVVRSECRRTAG